MKNCCFQFDLSLDAETQVLLTQEQQLQLLPKHGVPAVCLDSDWVIISRQSDENPVSTATAENLAYMIYTSGSTGQPKGVAVEQKQLLNRFHWMWQAYPFEPEEVCCQKTALNFVDSLWELLGPLLQGVPTVIIPDQTLKDPGRLIQVLASHQVTRIWLVPSLLRMLLDTYPDLQHRLPRLKFWVSSGEAISIELFQRFQEAMPHSVLFNLYGTSEVWDVTWYDPRMDKRERICIPIGRSISNMQTYILDAHHQPVPIGVPGELYVGGVGLARGYLNRPDQTAERFIPHPFSSESGARLYQTGDLARYLPNGNIDFLGRLDHQIKIRGFRIEPGEVEAILVQHPAVRQAVVVASETAGSPAEQRLVAYVVADQAHESIISKLRSFLREKLPEYMVPSTFVTLESVPLTPNGKVNRRALPAASQVSMESPHTFIPPGNTLELQMTQLWEEILAVKPIGIRDNFFELGGHSLLAIRLFAQIELVFDRTLPLAALFQAPTIEQLAGVLRRPDEPAAWSPLVTIQPGDSRSPFFWVHAMGGHVLCYRNLARYLGPDQPLYGLQAQGLDGKQAPHAQIQDMAADYIKAIRSLQPQGPYFLGGLSFGGLVAFEMAQQLYAQNQEAALLALFDTYAPGYLGSIQKTAHYKLYYFLQRVDFHLGNLLYFEAEDKRIYLRERLEIIQHRIRQNIPKFQWQEVRRSLPPAVHQVQEANYQAIQGYTPQLYPGRVTLFRARQQPPRYPRDPYLGWGGLAASGVEVHEVPGYHVSIIVEPHVRVLAKKLKDCLHQAQAAVKSY